MRVLITNYSLNQRAGTELVVYEVASELRRRGHQVAAYSSQLGEVAEMLRASSIPVITSPEDCPWVPDIIHGQHHLDAMTAIMALPGVPAIYHTHGGLPWQERPPTHPRILHYVAMCRDLADTQWIELCLQPAQISAVPNWVDLSRFRNSRSPGPDPKSALLFGEGLGDPSIKEKLAPVFAAQGIQLQNTADWTADERRAPELVLPRYDIVLGSGRSALEAMACGCAVVIANPQCCLGWVRPEYFFELQRQNFSPKRADAALNPDLITTSLATYDAEAAVEVTALVRERCTLTHAVDELLHIYEDTLALWPRAQAEIDPASENHAAYLYLRSLASAVRDVEFLQVTSRKLQSEVDQLTKERDKLAAQQPKLDELSEKNREHQTTLFHLREHWFGRLALSLSRRKENTPRCPKAKKSD
ncbi:MAG: glycosyltransferase [Verrucomicrobium sp.]|nr:glycosyltransferase [Verrucomicrobium sp.]